MSVVKNGLSGHRRTGQQGGPSHKGLLYPLAKFHHFHPSYTPASPQFHHIQQLRYLAGLSHLTGIDSEFSGNRKRVKTFKMKHLFNPFSLPDSESIYFPSLNLINYHHDAQSDSLYPLFCGVGAAGCVPRIQMRMPNALVWVSISMGKK